jgi:DNA-binding MarR family transcriptional regulator
MNLVDLSIKVLKGNEMNATRYMPESSKVFISNEELDQLMAISSDLEDERILMKKSNTHHMYMQFLQNALAEKPNKNYPTLTPNEEHLLEQIAIRCEMGNPINVSEACLMRQFGCVSTVHHQIQKLSSAGLIFLDLDKTDRRKKFINLSTDGLEFFKQIEDCLDMALKHN